MVNSSTVNERTISKAQTNKKRHHPYLNIIHTYYSRLVAKYTKGTTIEKISSQYKTLRVASKLVNNRSFLEKLIFGQKKKKQHHSHLKTKI